MYVGIDIEQFVRDPYASGIQRVLQYLARDWPVASVQADFVVPVGDRYALLSPEQAGDLISIAFAPRHPDDDLRALISEALGTMATTVVKPGDLLAIYDAWLLPEVSYLPSVLERFELFAKCVPTAMIGYDILPMSEPANYRFAPGSSAWVSEYFRQLATADAVVCISDYARDGILGRLRRDPALAISVAHPGGDHLPIRAPLDHETPVFARLGTLEARKRPVEILESFLLAVGTQGLRAELVFMGHPSASDDSINRAVRTAIADGAPVRWVEGASDAEVYDLVQQSSAFLSIGTEGYGIPVLEAIRLGTPVLFDGIQPAAELMVGRGARRIEGTSRDGLADAFVEFGRPEALRDLQAELQPTAVPSWRDFASAVARAVASG